jgi:hypothetical protein
LVRSEQVLISKANLFIECPSEDERHALWFSSRQLDEERSLASYVGTNEKSKLVIRLTAPGASGPPPPRTLDSATRELIDKVQESGLTNVIVLKGHGNEADFLGFLQKLGGGFSGVFTEIGSS